jgi:hypothetical protein
MEEEAADCTDLRAAVEAQAAALVDGDIAEFASYALTGALPRLYRSRAAGSPRSYEVIQVQVGAGRGHSEVRFRASPDFVLRSSWVETAEGWRAETFEAPEVSGRTSLLGRMLGFGRPKTWEAPQREDLS